jgi:Tol biopolymer transport system component
MRSRIYLVDVMEQERAEVLAEKPGYFQPVAWSPDGTKLACVSHDDKGQSHNWLVDIATKKVEEVRLPRPKPVPGETRQKTNSGEERQPTIKDWSSDGQWFLAYGHDDGLYLAKADGSAVKTLVEKGLRFRLHTCRFSPDGRQVVFDVGREDRPRGQEGMYLYVADTTGESKPRILADEPDLARPRACWSPDNKQVAYCAIRVNEDRKDAGETRLIVVDADGKNATVVRAEKHPPNVIRFEILDWR